MNRTERLRDIGQRLQQSIVLTRVRLDKIPASPLRAKAERGIAIADGTFENISGLVQAVQRTTGFMERYFNVSLRNLLGETKVLEEAGLEILITRAEDIVDELARINRAFDEKEKQNGTSTEERAA